MALRDAFVSRISAPAAGGAPDKTSGAKEAVGAFISSQSLVSFPIASAVASTVARLCQTFLKTNLNESALVACALIGTIVFLINVTDPQAKPVGKMAWLKASLIAFINSLLLLAGVLGISAAVTK